MAELHDFRLYYWMLAIPELKSSKTRITFAFALEHRRLGMDRKTITERGASYKMRVTPAIWRLTDQYLDRLIEEYKNE